MARIKRVIKATKNAIKEEVEEIKNLVITEDDITQAKIMRRVVVTAASAYGIPIPEQVQEILDKSLSYILRDAKDGLKTPEKLLVKRIIDNIKEDYK